MTIYGDVITILKEQGYKVMDTLQEKMLMGTRELVVLVRDMDIEVETNLSYMVTPTCAIIWNEDTSEGMLSSIPEIIEAVEQNLTTNNLFQFSKPKITIPGTVYHIELMFKYTEVLDI